MNLQEIKDAVDAGHDVRWACDRYKVTKSQGNAYYITDTINNQVIGLHGAESTEYERELNGKETEFYIKGE